jgi:hypothetical protein
MDNTQSGNNRFLEVMNVGPGYKCAEVGFVDFSVPLKRTDMCPSASQSLNILYFETEGVVVYSTFNNMTR